MDLVCLKEARRRGDEAAGKGSGSAQARPIEPEEATGHKLDHASVRWRNDIIHEVDEWDDILGFGERKEGKTLGQRA